MIWRIIKLEGENLLEVIISCLFFVISVILIFSIIVNPTGVTNFATKFPPINSIMCSGLKSEIAANDEIGRDLWNAYQTEISLLTNGTGDYRNKNLNVARRAKQLMLNNGSSLLLMNKKKYCVKDTAELQQNIKELNGSLNLIEGLFDDTFINWDKDYYSFYLPLSRYLK